MFAYCLNNPANCIDSNGLRPSQAINDTRQLVLAMALGVAAIAIAAPKSDIDDDKLIHAAARTNVGKNGEDTYSVYFLCAQGDPDQTIVYVGRVKSKNFEARMNYHKSVGRQLVDTIDGLDYASCRAVEQGGMMYYHTINRGNSLNNQIRGISPTNKNYPSYLAAIMDCVTSGLYPDDAFLPVTYWENLVEEDFLNLGG